MTKGTVLVTGGVGYIGSHTTVELLQQNYEVIIVDNLSTSQKEILEGIKKITGKKPVFYKVDLKNYNEVKNLLKKHKIDSIIHFAAYKAVGESVEKPLKYYENNILSLINTLKIAEEYKINNFIFSSSCTVYGQPKKLPVTEKTPVIKPNSPYGNTKKIAEEILQDTTEPNKNLNVVSLRYFNPIGAHPSHLIGELPIGVPNNLVPFITQTAYGIRPQLKVFGNDYSTPDGTPIRDYIDIIDLAEAHIKALEYLTTSKNKKNFEVFNIGAGKGYSVLEIIKTFEQVTGQKLNYTFAPRRPGDIEQIWADATKANTVLKWKTKRTPAHSLKTAWEWEKHYRTQIVKKSI